MSGSIISIQGYILICAFDSRQIGGGIFASVVPSGEKEGRVAGGGGDRGKRHTDTRSIRRTDAKSDLKDL